MPDRDDEIVGLLREIRDLQKAHFEKYVDFTARVLEQQRAATRRSEEDTAEALQQQRRGIQIARRSEILAPLMAAVAAILVVVLAILAFWR